MKEGKALGHMTSLERRHRRTKGQGGDEGVRRPEEEHLVPGSGHARTRPFKWAERGRVVFHTILKVNATGANPQRPEAK